MVGHLVLAAILFLPFENRTFSSGFRMVKTSQDRFGMNKIFVLLIKRSRLAIRNPDIFVQFSNGLDIKWSGLA
jgi:hypothetical protein